MNKQQLLKVLVMEIAVFLISTVILSAFNVTLDKKSESVSYENILYIGGSGPNNYHTNKPLFKSLFIQ